MGARGADALGSGRRGDARRQSGRRAPLVHGAARGLAVLDHGAGRRGGAPGRSPTAGGRRPVDGRGARAAARPRRLHGRLARRLGGGRARDQRVLQVRRRRGANRCRLHRAHDESDGVAARGGGTLDPARGPRAPPRSLGRRRGALRRDERDGPAARRRRLAAGCAGAAPARRGPAPHRALVPHRAARHAGRARAHPARHRARRRRRGPARRLAGAARAPLGVPRLRARRGGRDRRPRRRGPRGRRFLAGRGDRHRAGGARRRGGRLDRRTGGAAARHPRRAVGREGGRRAPVLRGRGGRTGRGGRDRDAPCGRRALVLRSAGVHRLRPGDPVEDRADPAHRGAGGSLRAPEPRERRRRTSTRSGARHGPSSCSPRARWRPPRSSGRWRPRCRGARPRRPGCRPPARTPPAPCASR